VTDALAAALSEVLQEMKATRQEIVEERDKERGERHKAEAKARPTAAGGPTLKASAAAGGARAGHTASPLAATTAEATGPHGVLTRPGPAGTWFVKFVDGGKRGGGAQGGEEAGDDEKHEDGGDGAAVGAGAAAVGGTVAGEQGPFPCTRDSPALAYPLMPLLRPAPATHGQGEAAVDVGKDADATGLAASSVSAAKPRKPRAPASVVAAEATTPMASGGGAAGGAGGDEMASDERRRQTRRTAHGEAGGVMDTILRVAVARARLVVNVSTDMLVHWLYSIRGLDATSLHLYARALQMNAIDGDLLLSLTDKELEALILDAKKQLQAPPHDSPGKQVLLASLLSLSCRWFEAAVVVLACHL